MNNRKKKNSTAKKLKNFKNNEINETDNLEEKTSEEIFLSSSFQALSSRGAPGGFPANDPGRDECFPPFGSHWIQRASD